MSQIESTIRDLFKDHKRVSPKEWAGPCPRCGGTDRCRVFESQGNQGLFRAWCRQCGMLEDALAIVQEVRFLTFAQAHTYLGLRVPEHMAARAGISELEAQRLPTPAELEAQTRARCEDLAWDMSPSQTLDVLMARMAPDGDPMYQAVVRAMTIKLAALELMAAIMYRRDPRTYNRVAIEIQERGFPWWSMDVLGIDQEAIDQMKGSDPWEASVK